MNKKWMKHSLTKGSWDSKVRQVERPISEGHSQQRDEGMKHGRHEYERPNEEYDVLEYTKQTIYRPGGNARNIWK